MGIFRSFLKGFNAGRRQSQLENSLRRNGRRQSQLENPIRRDGHITSSSVVYRLEGNTIIIQIIESNSHFRQALLNSTKTFANCLSREPDITWTQKGNSVEIVFPNANMAEKIYSQLCH